MILKILTILILLSPLCKGITYYFVSHYKWKPYCDFAKYQTIDDAYVYKNQQAAKVYCSVGGVISLFLILIGCLFHLFDTLPPYTLILGSFLISFLLESVLCDTLLNVRFTLDKMEENDENME